MRPPEEVEGTKKNRNTALAIRLGGSFWFLGTAAAGTIAPNPGGAVVVTNSTSATINYVDTPVTQRVDHYSTTLLALLNGNQLLSQTFAAPFTDPTVQAAIAQADGILSAHNASFGAPVLLSNASLLQSSVVTPPAVYNCLSAGSAPGSHIVSGSVTTVDTFGPASIAVGDCQQNTFNILSGQLDINVNTDFLFAIPRNIVTTNTFLTTQTFEIFGAAGTSVPEPASAGLVLLGLGAAVWWRRRLVPPRS